MKKTNVNIPQHPHFPERITLELTNACNLSCVFCPRKVMSKHIGFLDVELAGKLIDEMADHLPVSVVPFFRGEPLLHPQWAEILDNLKQKGIGPIQITSNATLLDEKAAQQLIDMQVDFISFSLDTLNNEKYESARRGAKYRQVTENIDTLLSLKKKSNSRYPEIQVSAIDIPEYQADMDDFITFWETRVDRVRIYIEHSKDGHPGSISSSLPAFETRQPCHKVFTDMVVLWDGEVALCNHDWTRDKGPQIGNVSFGSIEAVWQSERYRSIRAMHLKSDVTEETLCQHCDHWKMYYLPEGYLGKLYARPQ
jgi:sulfatase maturation enzyme AslB (radical SAM superfamily)